MLYQTNPAITAVLGKIILGHIRKTDLLEFVSIGKISAAGEGWHHE